jgi:alcohol dehydrogenase class IV
MQKPGQKVEKKDASHSSIERYYTLRGTMSIKKNVTSIPPTIIRAGGISQVGSLVKQFGGSSAFIVTDKGLTKAGIVGKVTAALEKAKIAFYVYDDVVANPTAELIDIGAKKLRETPDAVVVTLGGGSAMDAGKAIATLAKQPETEILDFCFCPAFDEKTMGMDRMSLLPKKFAMSAHKIIAIPTTSGTASETNGASVVTDAYGPLHKKVIFVADAAKASTIILDAELTCGVPAYPTATCGMDVLTHALEAYTSRDANAYGDAIALGAIKLVAQNLSSVLADPTNLELRQNMHVASHMAGVAFNISPLGIVHAMGHPLSAVYNQAHGQTLSTLLPVLMRFNMRDRADKYAEVAKAFNVYEAGKSDEVNGENAVKAIIALSKHVGTARSIESYSGGNFAKDLPELCRQALTDVSMLTTARQPTYAEVEELYKAAFNDSSLYNSPKAKL